jgi:hypothetical protein
VNVHCDDTTLSGLVKGVRAKQRVLSALVASPLELTYDVQLKDQPTECLALSSLALETHLPLASHD